MPICLLVRHGHSTANAEGVLAGWTPGVSLTERGQEQVAALGARLAALPIARIVRSPLQRCAETAAALEGPTGVTAVEDDRLGECRYGSWTGRALKDLAGEPLWTMVQTQPSAAAFPDGEDYPGESLRAMQHRAVSAIRQHDAEVGQQAGPHAVWVAVTHGDIIKSVLADAAGTHLDLFQRFQADPGSVSAIRFTSSRPFLIATNDLGSDLARLAPPADATEGEVPEGDAPVGGGSA